MDTYDDFYDNDPSGNSFLNNDNNINDDNINGFDNDYNNNMFMPYNGDTYDDCSTNLTELDKHNDISGNYNLQHGINIGIKIEFDKYSFFLNNNQNLYREIDNKFRRLKDTILESFKDTDIFIDSLELKDTGCNPLDYRSLLNQNLIKDINHNELYKELGIDYTEFSQKLDNIKSGMCNNFEKLQEYSKIIDNKIQNLDKDSIKLLGLIDLFKDIEDNDYKSKFRECILEGAEKIYMDTYLKTDIIEYKKCIQKHLLYLRLTHKISGGKLNPLCPLCLTNEIDITYISCGHTSCRDCFNSTNKKTCSICRSDINSIINLYII